MEGSITSMVGRENRAARRRREREEAKAAEAKAGTVAAVEPEEGTAAAPGAEGRINLQDVQTVLLGAAGWSVGHPPFPHGESRDNFRAACDRVAAFLDLTLGWPPEEDASPLALPARPSGLILPPGSTP